MVEQMGEGTPLEGDAQAAQVREIRLPQLSGLVTLGEIRLFGRTLQGAPDLHPALKGAQLPVGKRAGVLRCRYSNNCSASRPALWLSRSPTSGHTCSKGSTRVRQVGSAANWLGSRPASRYLRAVF